MAKWHSDCMEKPVRICFEFMGHFIGSHPWWFFLGPLVVSAALGSGFLFLERNLSNDIERQFTPLDGQAKRERRFIQEHFPEENRTFSSLRLSTDGTYGCFIATDSNVWSVESLRGILLVDGKIRNMTVLFEDELFEYVDVCSVVDGRCSSNAILDIIGYDASNVDHVNLTFPVHSSEAGRFYLHQSVGSVTRGNDSVVQKAEAIRLCYYLRQDNETITNVWLEKFMALLSDESTGSMQISYSTSRSMQWEFDKIPDGIIHLFAITYTVAITFSIISSMRLDNVRNKVCVAVVGVLSTGLGVVSSFGLLLFLGQPFVMNVAASPFMLLGVGLDDLFIMLSSWQQTRVQDGAADRLAATYKHAAISVSITTVTDALALFLGFSSPFGSVQSFCLYAGTGIIFSYLYSVTFLGAFLALNGRREAGNRHWLTCAPIPEFPPPPGKSKRYGLCCTGGAYDRDTGAEEEPPIGRFFGRYYGPFLTRRWTKLCVAFLYAGYLAVSVYGCCLTKEGIDLRNLAADDSYVIGYYDDQSAHFAAYGPTVMVAVTTPFPYWSRDGRRDLSACAAAFEELDYVEGGFSWFESYERYAENSRLDIGSEESFVGNLSAFLELHPILRQDLNMSADSGRIHSSRFFVQTLQRTSDDRTPPPEERTSEAELLTGLRAAAKRCDAADLLVYHPSFIYYDQYTVVVDNTVQTVAVAMVAMLVVSVLLIPDPRCSLWVAFAIGSVIVGVAGFMSLWGIRLDSISMLNLIICVGFSVDFSAHISYAFVSSAKADANERCVEALARLGYPIMQGGVSTILGVLALAASRCYIFRTFFKIMFLVISFGLVHGVVFIPVFLTLLQSCGK